MTGDDEYRSGYSINPDTFTFSEVSHCGKTMGMPELGVHMVIPEGALDKGYTEEIFLTKECVIRKRNIIQLFLDIFAFSSLFSSISN